jgi:D-alanyl-D-alanine carboxypeptidase
MEGVSAFSGYVKGPGTEHLIAFSIMINDYNCPKSNIEAWEDRIVEFLLRDF